MKRLPATSVRRSDHFRKACVTESFVPDLLACHCAGAMLLACSRAVKNRYLR